MSLSAFSSIYEVLAGLLIVFTGLEVATQSLTKKINYILYKFGGALTNIVARTALMDKTKYKPASIQGLMELSESAKSLLSYHLKLSAISTKSVKGITLAELVLRKKFVPVFLYATFFTFYNLMLCGISNADGVFVYGSFVIKAQDVCFRTLLFFNLYSFACENLLLFRNYRIPYKRYRKPNKQLLLLRALTRWPSVVKVFGLCSFGFLASLSSNFIPMFSVESAYLQLFIILFSIVVSVYPFISLNIWLNIGFNLKRKYIEQWSECLLQCYQDDDSRRIDPKKHEELNRFHTERNFWGLARLARKRYYKHVAIMAIVIGVLFLVIGKILMPDKQGIEKLITGETNAEFAAYKKLPNIDTLWFNAYFTPSGNARKKIATALLNHKAKGQTIKDVSNPSSHNIEAIKIIEWTQGRLKVQTSEYWYLRWFDIKDQKPLGGYLTPYFYPQFFYLTKDKNGDWKIDDIEYFGLEFN